MALVAAVNFFLATSTRAAKYGHHSHLFTPPPPTTFFGLALPPYGRIAFAQDVAQCVEFPLSHQAPIGLILKPLTHGCMDGGFIYGL